MMNKNGYTIKELIILFSLLAIVFAIGIIRGSYALEDAYKTDEIKEIQTNTLILAAETYAKMNDDKFQDEETYLFGSELVNEGLLMDTESLDYSQAKIKVTKSGDSYKAEIVE